MRIDNRLLEGFSIRCLFLLDHFKQDLGTRWVAAKFVPQRLTSVSSNWWRLLENQSNWWQIVSNAKEGLSSVQQDQSANRRLCWQRGNKLFDRNMIQNVKNIPNYVAWKPSVSVMLCVEVHLRGVSGKFSMTTYPAVSGETQDCASAALLYSPDLAPWDAFLFSKLKIPPRSMYLLNPSVTGRMWHKVIFNRIKLVWIQFSFAEPYQS